jgi:tripeptidyl-peptidase-1
MSLRGCTFVASSGDSGASGRTNEGCNVKPYLRAVYPTSSPYVVSVGGTTFLNETTGGTSPFCKKNDCVMTANEINTMFDNVGWASGSGISNYSEREYWTLTENRNYLSNLSADYLPHPSALSGFFMPVDGTSCSSPVFSGLLARLNSVRLNNGCPPFGAFGPFMYMMYEQCPTCFVDKVVGCSNSTEYGDCPPNIREYCATTGYDTIYGLGLPNYGNMAEFVKNQCLSMKKF